MKVQNSPGSYGFLAGLLVFLFGIIAAQWGCAHAKISPVAKTASAPGVVRTVDEAKRASAIIVTECGAGSGAFIDATRVLTAHHVIDCDPSEEKIKLATSIQIIMSDGRRVDATWDRRDPSRDLAVLLVGEAAPGVKPAKFSKVLANGQAVCAFVTLPEPEVRCQLARKGDPGKRAYGDMMLMSESTWHGNSGGVVYNVDGEVVGIVTRFLWCSDADREAWEKKQIRPTKTCAGRMSTVEGPVLQ